jgi:transporter family protein
MRVGQDLEARWDMPTSDWIVWALLSAVFAALTAVLAKVGLGEIDADFATLVRTVVILLVLAVFVIATGKWHDPRTLHPRAVWFLVLSGLATGASWVCYFRALKVGDAARVAPVDKLSVVLVAIFAAIFLHERPSPGAWVGIALVAAGVVVISLNR